MPRRTHRPKRRQPQPFVESPPEQGLDHLARDLVARGLASYLILDSAQNRSGWATGSRGCIQRAPAGGGGAGE